MKNCAIAIPVYKEITSENELFSLNQSFKVFKDRDIFLIIPKGLREYVNTLIGNKTKARIIEFNPFYFRSVKRYNQLLTSLDFYKKFEEYSHLCICQLDVLALQDNLDYWMEQSWDYIGAPIFEGYGNSNSYSFKTSLNGGFSLRDVEASIKVLKSIKFRYSTFADLVTMEKKVFLKLVRILRDGLIFNYNISPLRTRLNEDLYWAYITPRMHPWFSVPSPDVAQYFAFDKHPKWLFQRNGETLPTAVHAWQRYDPEFAVSLLNRLNENENVKLPEK